MRQNLVSVLSVGPVAPLASVTLPHGLKSNDLPVAPNQITCDRASSLAVTAASTTTVTFTNTSSATPATASFRVELDHSIPATGAPLIAWQGYVTPSSLPPSGPAGGDLDQTYPDPRVVGFAGQPIDTTAPAASDYWQFDGAVWRHTPVSPGTPSAVYGEFFSVLDQTISNGTGITTITLENGSGVGVSVVDPGTGPSRITVAAAGVYAFTISPQLLKTAGGGHGTVTFWPRKNGVDLPSSASFIAVTNNEHALTFLELLVPMGAGQWIEWVANADVPNCQLDHQPASVAPAVVRPAAPSVICGVKLIGI